jgi:cytochrome c oxidase assembly protein subunit 15
MWTEYLNRLLGVTVGFLILATMIVAIRDHRHTPRILWPTVLAFILVGFEGWLGGVVVREELAAWLVTAHLLVALVIVSLLLYATVWAFFAGTARPAVSKARRWLSWSTGVLIAVMVVQVSLGAQVRERVDEALMAGTARADALATVGTPDRWHRDVSLVVLGLVLIVLLQVWNMRDAHPALLRSVYVMVALVTVQLGLGVSLAYIGLSPPMQIAHLTIASLLLGAQTVLLLLARWLP